MLCLGYFDETVEKRVELRDELWLQGFVTRFLGELIFTHGRMTVAIEITEIALAVVTWQIDLAPVVLQRLIADWTTFHTASATSMAAEHSYRSGWPDT